MIMSNVSGLQVSVVGLERSLHQYTLEPTETPFDLKAVPLATHPIAEQKGIQSVISLFTEMNGHFIQQLDCLLALDK